MRSLAGGQEGGGPCVGPSGCEVDKIAHKVTFTRVLCHVDLSPCTKGFNHHVARGVTISAAGSAENSDPSLLLAQLPGPAETYLLLPA